MNKGGWILIGAILLGVVFLSSLGTWQLKRLAWKENLIKRVEAGMKKPPVSIIEIEKSLSAQEDIEYLPALVEGEFLHDAEAHYFATYKGKPVYHVYTPLRMVDGRILIVNRGYVPLDKKSADVRKDGLVKGQVQLSGLARSAPASKPNSFVPNNDLEKNVFYWKSLSEMSGLGLDKTQEQILPFFFDVGESTDVAGQYPIGGVTLIRFPNSHLQYALTWFGLAGALLVVGGAFLRSRWRANQAQ